MAALFRGGGGGPFEVFARGFYEAQDVRRLHKQAHSMVKNYGACQYRSARFVDDTITRDAAVGLSMPWA